MPNLTLPALDPALTAGLLRQLADALDGGAQVTKLELTQWDGLTRVKGYITIAWEAPR